MLIHIEKIEEAVGGDLYFDVFLYRYSVGPPEVKELLPNGHRTLVVPADAVLAVTSGAWTAVQKRKALRNLVRQQVALWKVEEANNAKLAWQNLLPEPYVDFGEGTEAA